MYAEMSSAVELVIIRARPREFMPHVKAFQQMLNVKEDLGAVIKDSVRDLNRALRAIARSLSIDKLMLNITVSTRALRS